MWKRWDVYPLFSTSFLLYYNFGTRIFDREELVPVLCFMLAIIAHSLLFFVNFWSADINVFFAYSKIDDIQECSDIWIKLENKKQQTIKTMVVPRLSLSVEITPGKLQTVYSLEYLKKRMLWSNEKKIFQGIPYPVKETIGFY